MTRKTSASMTKGFVMLREAQYPAGRSWVLTFGQNDGEGVGQNHKEKWRVEAGLS